MHASTYVCERLCECVLQPALRDISKAHTCDCKEWMIHSTCSVVLGQAISWLLGLEHNISLKKPKNHQFLVWNISSVVDTVHETVFSAGHKDKLTCAISLHFLILWREIVFATSRPAHKAIPYMICHSFFLSDGILDSFLKIEKKLVEKVRVARWERGWG